MRLPDAIGKFAREAAGLPSIGPRQAIRLAFHLVREGRDGIRSLSQAVSGLERVKVCSNCFFVHENPDESCDICKSPNRDKKVIMIVEKETDLASIEQTGKFSGRYLVLGEISRSGALENGQRLRLQKLKSEIGKLPGGKAGEIILALNPTSSGDFHASIIAKDLGPFAKKISRLGRGLPTGGEIEFADDETLGSALERRS